MDVVNAALESYQFSISFASKRIRSNRKLAMQYAENGQYTSKNIPSSLKNDKELALIIAKKNLYDKNDLPDNFFADKEFMIELSHYLSEIDLGPSIDLEYALNLIEVDPFYFKYLNPINYQNCLESVKFNYKCYFRIPNELKTKEIQSESLKSLKINDGFLFSQFPIESQNDQDFIKECLKINPKIFNYLNEDFKNDKKLCCFGHGFYQFKFSDDEILKNSVFYFSSKFIDISFKFR